MAKSEEVQGSERLLSILDLWLSELPKSQQSSSSLLYGESAFLGDGKARLVVVIHRSLLPWRCAPLLLFQMAIDGASSSWLQMELRTAVAHLEVEVRPAIGISFQSPEVLRYVTVSSVFCPLSAIAGIDVFRLHCTFLVEPAACLWLSVVVTSGVRVIGRGWTLITVAFLVAAVGGRVVSSCSILRLPSGVRRRGRFHRPRLEVLEEFGGNRSGDYELSRFSMGRFGDWFGVRVLLLYRLDCSFGSRFLAWIGLVSIVHCWFELARSLRKDC